MIETSREARLVREPVRPVPIGGQITKLDVRKRSSVRIHEHVAMMVAFGQGRCNLVNGQEIYQRLD